MIGPNPGDKCPRCGLRALCMCNMRRRDTPFDGFESTMPESVPLPYIERPSPAAPQDRVIITTESALIEAVRQAVREALKERE